MAPINTSLSEEQAVVDGRSITVPPLSNRWELGGLFRITGGGNGVWPGLVRSAFVFQSQRGVVQWPLNTPL